ncbi:DOPA 4,5-dioxygenase family protein [Aquisphaera insulae]|uniref:DOPA 4,5-dioxygenase family protein n=1 Tax=Aquisphaera insulae TaxID=2712864 RepID=UPI0013ED2FEF|nr:DOPA 4,5-dioxygenase family protein [Aquisphaera insulae]
MSHSPRDPESSERVAQDAVERVVRNTEIDQRWADWLAPTRRGILRGAGVAAAGLAFGGLGAEASDGLDSGFTPIVPPKDQGVSPWGLDTAKEPTPRPKSLWPGHPDRLPEKPRPYTDIKSYHAHFYFDEDSYEKAALLRKWSAERFPVELGNWNLEPRGPHVTPSFYFGFTNDLLPIIVPWLQLNSLGLTILLHPNTDDPRADHLYYTLWVNRSQPVNAYGMKRAGTPDAPVIEKILPNIKPTVKLEV